MSLRAYNAKNERVATGRSLGGQKGFAQFYPEKKAFASEEEWKAIWRKTDSAMIFSYLDPVDYLGDKMAEGMILGKKTVVPSTVKTPEVSTENWTFKPVNQMTAPPGTYYVGDLCYSLPDNLYEKVFGGTGYRCGLYTQTGTRNFFFLVGTGGDGEFKGSDGYSYCVDAGILGIAPVSICNLANPSISGGKIHTFESDVRCSGVNEGLTLRSYSGDIVIPEPEDEEDW